MAVPSSGGPSYIDGVRQRRKKTAAMIPQMRQSMLADSRQVGDQSIIPQLGYNRAAQMGIGGGRPEYQRPQPVDAAWAMGGRSLPMIPQVPNQGYQPTAFEQQMRATASEGGGVVNVPGSNAGLRVAIMPGGRRVLMPRRAKLVDEGNGPEVISPQGQLLANSDRTFSRSDAIPQVTDEMRERREAAKAKREQRQQYILANRQRRAGFEPMIPQVPGQQQEQRPRPLVPPAAMASVSSGGAIPQNTMERMQREIGFLLDNPEVSGDPERMREELFQLGYSTDDLERYLGHLDGETGIVPSIRGGADVDIANRHRRILRPLLPGGRGQRAQGASRVQGNWGSGADAYGGLSTGMQVQ